MSNYSRVLAFTVICLSFATASLSGCSTADRSAAGKSAPVADAVVQKYVSLDLAYPYYKMILEKLESRLKTPLKSRGEAHITLITPPEFKVLSTRLSPEHIHQVANAFMKENPAFTNSCVGHFQKKLDGRPQSVYYVVVESSELVQIRRQLATESGLAKAEFDPDLFYPHVTLGFTERDMHYEDGAIKNTKSCPADLKAVLRER